MTTDSQPESLDRRSPAPPDDRVQAPTRRWKDYARDGWKLGGVSLAVAGRGVNLRRFAVGAYGAVVAIEVADAVATVALHRGVTVIEWVVFALVSTYLAALLSNLAAVGLAGLVDRALDEETAPVSDGWRLMWKRLPQVAGWALIVVLIGVPARIITGWGVDQLAAILIGFSWGVVSFFAVPAMALAGDGPVQAGLRSVRLVGRQWGSQVAGMVYVWLRPTAFIGVPGALATVAGVVLALRGHDVLGWSLGAGGVVAMAIAYLLIVTANSVLSVAIFRFADGRPLPADFDRELLERVLRPPAPLAVRAIHRIEGERLRRWRAKAQALVEDLLDRSPEGTDGD